MLNDDLAYDPTGAPSSKSITRYLAASMVSPCNRGSTINMIGRMNMQMLLTAVLTVHSV